MRSGDKVRAYRQRQRAGLAVLKVPVQHYDLVQALIEAERLSVDAALDRHRVERAAAEVLNDFAKAWLKNCNR
jgi:hypothetical protein